MKLDILAFGVHPDDIELGCAGTLIKAVKHGKRVGAVDLTRGELGSRGSVEIRKEEAVKAAERMGIEVRENLGLPDGFIQDDEPSRMRVIEIIRKYRPDVVVCNAPHDRHPDHGISSTLVRNAAFLSGLLKIETFDNGLPQQHWRPSYLFKYIQDEYLTPSFVVDITDVYEQKMEAIYCFNSQFMTSIPNYPETYISSPQFLEAKKGRDMAFGKWVGVGYAEGFISEKLLAVRDFDAFIQQST